MNLPPQSSDVNITEAVWVNLDREQKQKRAKTMLKYKGQSYQILTFKLLRSVQTVLPHTL